MAEGMSSNNEKKSSDPYEEKNYEPGNYKPGPYAFDTTSDESGGVLKEIIKPGICDCLPKKGYKVSIHYIGFFGNGSIFENTKESNDEPFTFILGEGKTIKALDIGVSTMRLGEISMFTCKLSYCFQLTGKKKKNSTMKKPEQAAQGDVMFFKIELLSWEGEDISPKKDGSILRRTLIDGEEDIYPVKGNLLCLGLVCELKGKVVHERKRVVFFLGNGSQEGIPSGVERALEKIKIKEKAHLTVAPKFAWGTEGNSKIGVPPNSVVDFIITLFSLERVNKVFDINPIELNFTANNLKERGNYFYKKGDVLVALKFYMRMLDVVHQSCGAFYTSPDGSSGYVESTGSIQTDELRKELAIVAHLNIAACFIRLKDFGRAEHHCHLVLSLDPQNEKGLFRRGEAFLGMKLYKEAKINFEEVLKLNANNKLAKDKLQICLQKITESNLGIGRIAEMNDLMLRAFFSRIMLD